MKDLSEEAEEMLEPVEETAFLEGEEDDPPPGIPTEENIPLCMRSFINSMFPVLLVDKELRILFTNRACANLFTNYCTLVGNYFTDIFGKALGIEAMKEMLIHIRTGKQGYSWKGFVKTKRRDAGSLETKLYLFPALLNKEEPEQFIILFDDVTEENKKILQSIYASLLEASKLKDNDTGKHIIRVNYYSSRLARELYNKPGYEEVDRDFIEDIGFLASMHDVGKIGTPDDILNKEGPLEEWEWTIMKEHTKNGTFILSTYPNPMARDIALNHHERWDGTGYPFQLEGTMIPLAARIVTIADVYDALRMKRTYKPAYDHLTAVKKMAEWRGKHFDPYLFDVFYGMHEEFNRIFEENKDPQL
ncbi:MAG TPA: HD domain-containing protein [Termitinemataceae bacterium]|nr:HD domain-containing protein [Termitinemataceae bacterium]HOM23572.1 HD domain-containing protein [Termitinemataceae bacterium]HPP99847.1 HD domain-containing protein [Termitinemataceae bacterium]